MSTGGAVGSSGSAGSAGAPGRRGVLAAGLGVTAAVAYPFAVAAGLDRGGVRTVALPLLGLLAVVALSSLASSRQREQLRPLLLRRFGLLAAAAGVALATGHPLALLALPTVMSLWLLWTFGSTLRRGRPIVEEFARGVQEGFPDFLVPYCRNVTLVWCAFFALNALVSGALAVAGPLDVWALYTGALSYGLIAVLAAGEYLLRKTLFRFYEGGCVDAFWRRLCPPEKTALGRRTLRWQRVHQPRYVGDVGDAGQAAGAVSGGSAPP